MPVVVNAEDVSMILAAPAKITAKKDVNIVLKKVRKIIHNVYKNAQAQVDNQTKKAISVKIADGTTLKVESGESCTITPKGKKEDTSGEDKTDEKIRWMEKTRKQTIPRTEMLLPAVLLRAILLVEQQLRHLQS